MDDFFSDADLISYSRADALADGTRVNVPEATRYGVKIPLDLTEAVNRVVDDISGFGQSREGRLHDLLSMFRFAVIRHRDKERFTFRVTMVSREAPDASHPDATHTFVAAMDVDDNGEPLILIGYPEDF